MEKVIKIIKKSEQEKADKEYWQNASIEERFEAFNVILKNHIALTYGEDPGFQRVLRVVSRKQADYEDNLRENSISDKISKTK